jgi:hypothetical protein
MTKEEIAREIRIQLGGKQYCLEIADEDIYREIDRAFHKALAWYDEMHYVTRPINKLTNFSGVINLSAFPKPVDDIIEVIPVNLSLFSALSRFDSDLWGIKQLVLDVNAIGDLAMWIGIRPQIEQVLSSLVEYVLLKQEGKLLLTNLKMDTMKATVAYSWLPTDVKEVTFDKALQWIIDYSIALCKVAVGHGRSKYSSGGLNFQMDGPDMIQEGTSAMQALDEALPNLHFNYHVLR